MITFRSIVYRNRYGSYFFNNENIFTITPNRLWVACLIEIITRDAPMMTTLSPQRKKKPDGNNSFNVIMIHYIIIIIHSIRVSNHPIIPTFQCCMKVNSLRYYYNISIDFDKDTILFLYTF